MTSEGPEAFLLDVSPQLGVKLLAVVVTERIEETARRLLAENPSRTLTLREITYLVTAEVVEIARAQGMDKNFCDALAATVIDCAMSWFTRASATCN